MMAVLIFGSISHAQFVPHMPLHYKEASISLQELRGLITSSIPLNVMEAMNVGLLFTVHNLVKGFKFYPKLLGNE